MIPSRSARDRSVRFAQCRGVETVTVSPGHPAPARPAPSWLPSLGACPEAGGVSVRVWAPARERVEIVLTSGPPSSRRRRLTRDGGGMFTGTFPDMAAGDLYSYALDDDGPFPDPASRFQPQASTGRRRSSTLGLSRGLTRRGAASRLATPSSTSCTSVHSRVPARSPA